VRTTAERIRLAALMTGDRASGEGNRPDVFARLGARDRLDQTLTAHWRTVRARPERSQADADAGPWPDDSGSPRDALAAGVTHGRLRANALPAGDAGR